MCIMVVLFADNLIVSARQHICRARYAITQSVRLFVRYTGRVEKSKTKLLSWNCAIFTVQ